MMTDYEMRQYMLLSQRGSMNPYDLETVGITNRLLSVPRQYPNYKQYYVGIDPCKTDEKNKNNLILLLL